MSPHRSPRPSSSRRDDLLVLERFYICVLLMERAYEKATSDWAARVIRRASIEELVSLTLERDSYFNLWMGCLRFVLECWQERLRCTDPQIDELLDSELTPLLEDFRNRSFILIRTIRPHRSTILGRKR